MLRSIYRCGVLVPRVSDNSSLASRSKIESPIMRPPEQFEFAKMGGVTLRKAMTAAVSHNIDPDFWRGAARRAKYIAANVKYWDCLSILQSLNAYQSSLNSAAPSWLLDCGSALADSLKEQMSQMSPKHVIEAISIYESLSLRPKDLYSELFHAIYRLTPAMYVDELAATALTLARFSIVQHSLLDHFSAGIVKSVGNVRFLHACIIAGSFAAMKRGDGALFAALHDRVKNQVKLMRPEELIENLNRLSTLPYSYSTYEEELAKGLEVYLKDVTSSTPEESVALLNQLSSPVDLLLLLRIKGRLTPAILSAYIPWLSEAVRRPNTRMGKRIKLDELTYVADLCADKNVAVKEVQRCIDVFINGEDLSRKPLRYHSSRKYIRRADPYKRAGVLPVRWKGQRVSLQKKASPTRWLKAGQPAAWTSFPLPWYYNK